MKTKDGLAALTRATSLRGGTDVDALARTLAAGTSRRGVLHAAGVLAALLAGLHGETTAAKGGRGGYDPDRDNNDKVDKSMCRSNSKQCFDGGCVVCQPGKSHSNGYARFESCVKNRHYCEDRSKPCCEFCAEEFAGHGCICCS